MATETRYLWSDEDLSSHANQVKELVSQAMASKGLITQEEADTFATRYVIVIAKKGWMGSLIDKALNLDDSKSKKMIILDRGE
jgi:hypothetical protein